jgi:membrane-bound lytic murein transglycosylase C
MQKPTKILMPFIALLTLLIAGTVMADQSFEDFKREEIKRFVSYVDEQEKDYNAYKQEVLAKWGEFIGSTKKVWVDYGDDKEIRSQVDFEKGKISVDILVPKSAPDPEQVAREKIKKELKRMVSDKWPTGANPLAGQVQVEGSQTLNEKNVDTFVNDKLRQKMELSNRIITQEKEPPKQVVSVEFPMVPDHLKVRAEKYRPTILHYSRERHLDPTVVFGVIHTESAFNPMARSHVPAFGLMQIVPASGGRDAYRYVFKKDIKPTAKYLYNPENNINLGTAYLSLTKNRYFAGVKDETSAYLMTVAAYNTGAGNVARALTGKTSLKLAAEKANQMSAQEVYTALRRNLPYAETQAYVQHVFSRSKLYRGL